MSILEFEKPIAELEEKINELKKMSSDKIDLSSEIEVLNGKLEDMKKEIYGNLDSWQRVQICRHPQRPYTLDYIDLMTNDFIELHGDRLFADDLAMIAGLATIGDQKVLILGHQKGRDVDENIKHNFGCAHPEGYRKAMRLMEFASRFKIPIVILIDTPGAYPGIGAEERGQAQAIAENIRDMAMLETPVIAAIIGEGGSGGALGVGVADRVLILKNAYYSVISPEGCASILWRDSTRAPDAAEALKFTGEYLINFGIVDEIIDEPYGGAHRDYQEVSDNLKKVLLKHIQELKQLPTQELLNQRYAKFRSIGEFSE